MDECGKQVKENEIGEIVVTGFSHLGTPFIRYKTGDLAVYGGTTEFGEVVLKQLMGRSVDSLSSVLIIRLEYATIHTNQPYYPLKSDL